jgi:hypothetical protein
LLIRSLHQTGEWTVQSLVRPRWRNVPAATVNEFTGGVRIEHFVMAVTADAAAR